MSDSCSKLHSRVMHPERRRWVLMLCYCLVVVMVWLLPTVAWGWLRPYGEAWLAPARAVVRKMVSIAGFQVATAAGEFIVALGSLCIIGALLSPFLCAFLSRSKTVRMVALLIGVLLLAGYFGLAIMSFKLDRWSLD